MDMDHYTGVFTGKIIRLISDIRAKHGKDSVELWNCGKFTLAEDLSDISDMTSINLSSIGTLEGRYCFAECSFLRLPVHFFGRNFPSRNLARIFSSTAERSFVFADQCAILEEISPLRILLEFSRVACRT